MKLEISEIEVQKLSVKPDEILVLRVDREEYGKKRLEQLVDLMKKILPKTAKCVIMYKDIELSKITPEVE